MDVKIDFLIGELERKKKKNYMEQPKGCVVLGQ